MPKLTEKTKTGRSHTPKGIATRTAILDTAQEVFKDTGYYSSSVSEITRRSGVSMGTFYQYFKNKEQIFQELSDLIIARFWEQANALSMEDKGPEERLAQVVRLLFDHLSAHFYFHRMLGEFELIDPVTIGYYDSITRFYRRFFRKEMGMGFIRPLDPNLIAYGLLGIVYFHLLDWKPEGKMHKTDQLLHWTLDLLRKGISGPKPWGRPLDLALSAFPEKLTALLGPQADPAQDHSTKRAIFQAAEKVFGQHGFNRTNISEITRLAGVAQGTFYIHFKSKRDLLEGFVRYLSRELRRTLKLVTEGLEDRRDKEREGMLTFFRFLRLHSPIYRVIAESETVGQQMGMWYYKKLAEGYISGLKKGVKKGEIRDLPVDFLARSLMGFNHMIGLKWLVWKSFPPAEFPKPLLNEAIQLVMDGIAPS